VADGLDVVAVRVEHVSPLAAGDGGQDGDLVPL